MADFCVDCADYEGHHDLPNERGWYLCEGCGYHIFTNGLRVCRRGRIPIEDVYLEPCEVCASFVGTDEDI